MALLFFDGFDHYDDDSFGTAYAETKWNPDNVAYAGLTEVSYTTGNLSDSGYNFWNRISQTEGRRGGGAYQSDTSYTKFNVWRPAGGMSKTTLIVGFARKLPMTVALGAGLLDAAEQLGLFAVYERYNCCHLYVNLRGDGSVGIYRNNFGSLTLLGESDPMTWLAATYYYIEFKFTLADYPSGYAEVRRDGGHVLTVSNVKTTNDTSGVGVCDRMLFNGPNTTGTGGVFESLSDYYCDDFYICDDTGADNNDFLGDVRVDTYFAEAAGTYSEWTPDPSAGANYEMIDDRLVTSADAVQSFTPGARDTYVFNATTHIPDAIFGLQVTHVSIRTDGVLREVKAISHVAGSPGGDFDLSSAQPLTDNWSFYSEVNETNPLTGAAWTKDDIDNTEFGIEVVT